MRTLILLVATLLVNKYKIFLCCWFIFFFDRRIWWTNLPSRISEWHPFPGSDFTYPNLGFHLLISLIGICRNQWWGISKNNNTTKSYLKLLKTCEKCHVVQITNLCKNKDNTKSLITWIQKKKSFINEDNILFWN